MQDQAYILTLVENLQREDLTPKEEAAALEVLVREHGWPTYQVGEAMKRSPIYVSRRLRVFDEKCRRRIPGLTVSPLARRLLLTRASHGPDLLQTRVDGGDDLPAESFDLLRRVARRPAAHSSAAAPVSAGAATPPA